MNLPQNSNIPDSQLYDLAVINKMCRNNEDQVLNMVKVFIDQISESIQGINTAYSEKDFIKIKSLAHKIKPLFTYFGTAVLEKEFLLAEELFSTRTASTELELKLTNFNEIAKEVINVMKNDFNLINK
ncbi:Hpt domain-containing protein [Polaribacter litorisediminis]|uniref:Hpt domain-containing protein n=1 Tax=Polaribacter litorisediminis TaxID=1908341 RepID=UPI001CBAFA50|nr:Hpt domain-containing protein [Polaribacter litorisediminis]UAM96752.1 Hpt domain-containing protein [Polaribacter litorisediminis]